MLSRHTPTLYALSRRRRAVFTLIVVLASSWATVAAAQSKGSSTGSGSAVSAPGAGDEKASSSRRRLDLGQWLSMIRESNPSVDVARARLKKFDADVFAAKWSWLPKVKMKATVAPTPRYECVVPTEFLPSDWTEQQKQEWLGEETDGVPNRNKYCVTTNKDTDIDEYSIDGLYARFEVDLGLPLSAAWKGPLLSRAAKAARKAARHKTDKVLVRMIQRAKKAYWGVKLAREMLFTISEGKPYLRKAIKKVERDLDSDEGESSLGDKFRLHILKSQVETWILDAKQVEAVALAGLRALAGKRGDHADLDVDNKPLLEVADKLESLDHYLRMAVRRRPEVRRLAAAIKGGRAMVKLRKSEFFPDLVLGTKYRYTYSNSDDPASAYAHDRLHGNSIFVGLVLKWDLDFHLKHVKLQKAKADLRVARRGKSALSQRVRYEVKRAYTAVATAQKKVKMSKRAHRLAKSWVTAVTQKHDMGLARAKEVADALKAYFQTKMEYAKAIYAHRLALAKLRAAAGLSK
jgi:outer membrane protein TolC